MNPFGIQTFNMQKKSHKAKFLYLDNSLKKTVIPTIISKQEQHFTNNRVRVRYLFKKAK